jgi:hypothetical protein
MEYLKVFFENFTKIITGLTFVLIVYGYIALSTYYNQFDITISDYISFSEILPASIATLVHIFSLLIIPFLIIFFLSRYHRKTIETKNEKDEIITFRIMITVLILTIVTFAIVEWVLDLIKGSNLKNFFEVLGNELIIFIIGYAVTLAMFDDKYLNFFKRKFEYPYIIVVVLALLFVLTIQVFASNKSKKEAILKGNENNMEVIFNNGQRFSTNDSIGFIGKTSNYYFFYNRKRKASIIYPSRDVKESLITDNSFTVPTE